MLCLAAVLAMLQAFGSVTPVAPVEDAVRMDTLLTEGVHLFVTHMLQSVVDDCTTCVATYTAPKIELFKDVCAICITEYQEHGLNLYSKSCQDCMDIYRSHLMMPYAGTYALCRRYYKEYDLELFGTGCTGCITAYLDSELVLSGEACSHCLRLFVAHTLTVYDGSCYGYLTQTVSQQLAKANISISHNFKLSDIMYEGPLPIRLYKKYVRIAQNYYLPLWHSFYKENRYSVILGGMSLLSLITGLGLLHCGIYTH